MQLSDIEQEYNLIKVKAGPLGQNTNSKTKVFIVEGRNFLDKVTALRELYTVFGFAEYIPHANYDGLDELLSPDMWTDLPGMTLCVVHAKSLEIMNEEDLRKLLEVLVSIVDDWKTSGKVLNVELAA